MWSFFNDTINATQIFPDLPPRSHVKTTPPLTNVDTEAGAPPPPPPPPQQQQQQQQRQPQPHSPFSYSPSAVFAGMAPFHSERDAITSPLMNRNGESSKEINAAYQPLATPLQTPSYAIQSAAAPTHQLLTTEETRSTPSNVASVPLTALSDSLSLQSGTSSPQLRCTTNATAAAAAPDSRQSGSIAQRNVYISGLPSVMQSSEFRELCLRFGAVEASKLCVEGPSNPTKGYGFVLYYSEASAAACIQGLCGSYLNGRCLQARLADTNATPASVGNLSPAALHPSLARVRTGRRERRRNRAEKLRAARSLNAAAMPAAPAAPLQTQPYSPGSFPVSVNAVPASPPMLASPGVYYACAGNQRGGGEAPVMVLQPHPFAAAPPPPPIVYMTASPYASGGVAGGVTYGPPMHVVSPMSPLTLSAPAGMQFYSLMPSHTGSPM